MEFSYDFNRISATAAAIGAASKAVTGEMQDFRSVCDQIAWEGANQAAYHQTQLKLEESVNDLNALLDSLGKLVDEANANTQAMESKQAQMWA
jgi:WXG100 family type VII secretion target